MLQFATDLLATLEEELNSVLSTAPTNVMQAEKALCIISKFKALLKKKLVDYIFPSSQDEIEYFKEFQPRFMSKLFYFKELLSIELQKPEKCLPENMRSFYQKWLKHYKKYFKANRQLYKYLKNKSSHLDDKYFIRSNTFPSLSDECIYISDPAFTTGYDIIMARFIAYELICDYIFLEIKNIDCPERNTKVIPSWENLPKCEWTDSKAALTEMIYAIHSAKSINNGNIDILELISVFEMLFDIELNDSYRTFFDLKNRAERTKYLDNLRIALMNKMEKDLN